MDLVTRWVGLGCVLSVALAGACGGGTSSASNAAAGAGVGGNGSAGAASGEPSAGSAGTGERAGSTGNAGTRSAAGGASGSGVGGSTNNAGVGGKLGDGGGCGAAGTQGGAGGTQGGGSCGGAEVVFLIQRSGVMFEQPLQTTGVPLPLEASYFGFLQAALVGEGSAAKAYSGKLSLGVTFLFAARDLSAALPVACPQLAMTTPRLQFDSALSNAFTQSAADHAALVTAKQKEEAPVPEAIVNAVASLPETAGARHLVLVTTAMPDTCTKLDGPCGLDATVKALQDAKVAGVTTHVIGVGDDVAFNNAASGADPEQGYEEYLQQLANAGSGQPVGPGSLEHKLQDFVCEGATAATLTASYAGSAGNAKYYQVKTATDAKAAVADILASICL